MSLDRMLCVLCAALCLVASYASLLSAREWFEATVFLFGTVEFMFFAAVAAVRMEND